MESVELANGESVGVAEVWEWPDAFDDIDLEDLLAVQHAIDGKGFRFSEQSGKEWAGNVVAEILNLDADDDKKRIKKIIAAWVRSGALLKGSKEGPQRRQVPTLEVGEWANS